MKKTVAALFVSYLLAGCCSGIDCAEEAKLVCEGEKTKTITGRYGSYTIRSSCTRMYYACIEPMQLTGDSEGKPICVMPTTGAKK